MKPSQVLSQNPQRAEQLYKQILTNTAGQIAAGAYSC